MIERIRKFFKALGKKEGGFTLIELAVILAVIGILAAVGTMKYIDITSGAMKTNATARLADIKSCISMAMAQHGGTAVGQTVINNAYKGYPANCTASSSISITWSDVKDKAGASVVYTLQNDGAPALTTGGNYCDSVTMGGSWD